MSVREVVNVLAGRGYLLYVCDPDPFCVARFSQHVTRFFRCPPMGLNPEAYFDFVNQLIERERIDVLLPVHEQAYLFAGLREDLPASVRLALTSFENFSTVQNKVLFTRLLEQLGLPQPKTTIVTSKPELLQCAEYPYYVKAAFGTASRALWLVHNADERETVAATLETRQSFADGILVQQVAAGELERAQAIFNSGSLVYVHGYRRVRPGIGGGDAIKESVSRPIVAEHFSLLGSKLNWHGPLSVDYIYDESSAQPYYIDGNPRLVEPMNAKVSGVDLVQAWLDLTREQSSQPKTSTRPGVRTHMALQALLGHAQRENDRLELCREGWRLLRKAPPYNDSVEELTPFKTDPLSCVIVIAVLVQLLLAPRRVANHLSASSGARHHVTRAVVQYVQRRRQEREIEAR